MGKQQRTIPHGRYRLLDDKRSSKPNNVTHKKVEVFLVNFGSTSKFYIITNEEDKSKLQQCYNREWFKTAPMYIIASILHDEEWVRSDGKHHGDFCPLSEVLSAYFAGKEKKISVIFAVSKKKSTFVLDFSVINDIKIE